MSRDFDIEISVENGRIVGTLALPNDFQTLVLLADGNGKTRLSPREQFVAETLRRGRFGTFLLDLLTGDEARADEATGQFRFDTAMLGNRVVAATDWLAAERMVPARPMGLLGAGTAAAAVLRAAAMRPDDIGAVVLLGGRPDLAAGALAGVRAPTLLLVAEDDDSVLSLNRDAWGMMAASHKDMRVIAGASHLFEEPGAIDEVADLTREWFEQFVQSPALGVGAGAATT